MMLLLRFLFSAIALLITARVIPGVNAKSFVDLLAVAVILGALNATLGSLLKFIAFIPVACSFGCFSLVINGLLFWLVGSLAHRLGLSFQVSGFWAGFFGALLSGLITWVLEMLFLGKKNRVEPPSSIKVVN